MKKSIILLLAFILANSAFAQTTSKKKAPSNTVAQPAAVTKSAAVAPKLVDKDPLFMGFTGSFIKFGRVSGNGRSFTMSAGFRPWFFEIKGVVDADHNTEELDALIGDIVTVVAYYNAQGKAQDGTSYQAGIFDFMMYLDDEPLKISNLSITLTDKAAAGATVLEQAKTWNFEQGKIFRTKKYDNGIIKAQATALDRSDIAKEKKKTKKRTADSIAKEKKRVEDSTKLASKKKRDSIARERQRIEDSIAEYEALKEQARRKAAAAKKKRQMEEEDEDDYEPPKKKATSTKKKRVVEEDEDDYEPPPKKKTKKKRLED
jgi:hypothetical protein